MSKQEVKLLRSNNWSPKTVALSASPPAQIGLMLVDFKYKKRGSDIIPSLRWKTNHQFSSGTWLKWLPVLTLFTMSGPSKIHYQPASRIHCWMAFWTSHRNKLEGGGHRTEKVYTVRWGHRTYFLNRVPIGGDTAHQNRLQYKLQIRLTARWVGGWSRDYSTTSWLHLGVGVGGYYQI